MASFIATLCSIGSESRDLYISIEAPAVISSLFLRALLFSYSSPSNFILSVTGSRFSNSKIT